MPDDNTNPVDPMVTPVAPLSEPSVSEPAVSEPPIPEPPVPEPTVPSNPSASDSVVVNPVLPDDQESKDPAMPGSVGEVVNKINDAQNILIALSSDPSVDELAAAIGLSLYLSKLDKRATAIYSGATPNALEFLKPEETFEPTVDTLQDFVIALNKEKADHLRYKLDGDYVKIYITPYHARITEEDLEFTYGDFNVDLVLALDVANGIDLDAALLEHGRIMHDASIVNITTGNPGKLGEIEWCDKSASSVSEMIARLLYSINSKTKIEKEEATAFLTGIVAATDRFSSANTTPETMKIASRLMESGANQQLVSKNITPELENEMFTLTDTSKAQIARDKDPTKLDVEHEENQESKSEAEKESEVPTEAETKDSPAEPKEVSATVTEKEHTLLDDLKAAEASLSQAGAEITPEATEAPLKIDTTPETTEPTPANTTPQTDMTSIINEPAPADTNPAASSAPSVPENPEINGVPEINYNMPLPGEEVLPPPPTPPLNLDSSDPLPPVQPVDLSQPLDPIQPATPPVEPTPEPLGSQPSMQDQVYAPQASDPAAFKIPGM